MHERGTRANLAESKPRGRGLVYHNVNRTDAPPPAPAPEPKFFSKPRNNKAGLLNKILQRRRVIGSFKVLLA